MAVITHADVIRMAVADLSGVHLDLFQRFVVGPASVSAILLDGGRPHILRLNDTGDLRDLVPPAGRGGSPRPTRRADLRRRESP